MSLSLFKGSKHKILLMEPTLQSLLMVPKDWSLFVGPQHQAMGY